MGVRFVDLRIRDSGICSSFVLFILGVLLLTGCSLSQCNDNNPCTDDIWDQNTGNCTYVNNAAACEDGNACTTGETCSGGSCGGGAPVSCDDDGNPCTDDSCDPETGCVYVNNAAPCDDGNACTAGDICSGGSCSGGVPASCDDSNPCTDDSCDPATGVCKYENNAAPCDDGNACTSGDTCSGGSCQGAEISCNDNNLCTDDNCNPATGCVNVNNAAPCDDGDACTTADTCTDGFCKGVAIDCDDDNESTNISSIENDSIALSASIANPLHHHKCDDHDPCTEDTFNGKNCVHKQMNCDDGNPNTYDYCYEGNCYNTTTKCDDGNACTEDSFDGVKCVNTTINCDDGNACNGVETCNRNTGCVPGTPLNCDDNNPCTYDKCNPKKGCIHPSKCDDGNPCTVDRCGPHGCTHTQVVCSHGRVCIDGFCRYPYYPYYYYYPYEVPFFSPGPSVPASPPVTPRYYILPAGSAVSLPWGQSVTAVEAMQVHNGLIYPGSSPISFTRNIIRPISVGSISQSSFPGLNQAEMIGLSWTDSGFNLTLLQPGGTLLPEQGDGWNVVHLTGPKYDYYFLRSPAPGNWIIRLTPINPASSGASYSLIYGRVQGVIPSSQP